MLFFIGSDFFGLLNLHGEFPNRQTQYYFIETGNYPRYTVTGVDQGAKVEIIIQGCKGRR
jgi:hypothetical protein